MRISSGIDYRLNAFVADKSCQIVLTELQDKSSSYFLMVLASEEGDSRNLDDVRLKGDVTTAKRKGFAVNFRSWETITRATIFNFNFNLFQLIVENEHK